VRRAYALVGLVDGSYWHKADVPGAAINVCLLAEICSEEYQGIVYEQEIVRIYSAGF
jgi:hypothetical protein